MGGPWAAGDRVAWRGQHREGAPGFCGPEPVGIQTATKAKGKNESPESLY